MLLPLQFVTARMLACSVSLQYGTIDFGAVTAELPVSRDAEGAFLAIPGLSQ